MFISFVGISICSRTSFLYPLQDWCDPNCFFTTGKAMANGFVLYKDILEQKGIILYVLHTIGYLISNDSFFGVYLIQIVSFSIFLLFVYKTSSCFLSKTKAYAVLPIITLLLLTSKGYANGDSAEEFCLPLFAVGIYILFRYFNNTAHDFKKAPMEIMFCGGLCAGAVLWIKYTLLGFWIGFVGVVIIMYMLYGKPKDALKSVGMFALGSITISGICVLYFVVNNAFNDMIDSYFLMNIFCYSENSGDFGIVQKLVNVFWQIVAGFGENIWVTVIMAAGLIIFTVSGKLLKATALRCMYIPLCLITLLFTYIGGTSWAYYFFANGAFAAVGLIALFYSVPPIIGSVAPLQHFKKAFDKKPVKLLCVCAVTAAAFVMTYFCSSNVRLIGYPKENTSQYIIAKEINKTENSTMLNYGCLDSGVYTVANKLPVTKYFCRLNIPYKAFPQMMNEQNEILRTQRVDYVVINTYTKDYPSADEIPYLLTNYELVTECTSKENKTGDYSLYKRKGL